MNPHFKHLLLAFLTLSLTLGVSSVVAERPQGAGKERGPNRHEYREDRDDDHRRSRHERHEDDHRDERLEERAVIRIGGYFGERERAAIYAYYGAPPKPHCPPGLAKKNNGCQPPGQAKKWRLGQPLPRDVVYRPVEADVRVRLGRPPAGYDFVRVAGDILLIAVGTSMVIDAIEDLQR